MKTNNSYFIGKYFTKGIIFNTFLSINIILTFAYKYELFYRGEHLKYTWIPDLIFASIISMILLYRRSYKLLLVTFLLLLVKILGSFLVYDFYESNIQFFKEVFKTVFSFIFIFYVYAYLRNFKKKDFIIVFNLFKHISVLINLTIIFGAVFSISLFKTYIAGRFGFSGLLYPSSFSSYFVIVSILIFYYFNKNIKQTHSFYITLTILAALAIGTKAVYFFLSVLLFLLFINKKVYKNKKAITFIGITLSVAMLNIKTIKYVLLLKFQTLYKLFIEEDLITFLLSFRNLKFTKAKEYVYNNWSLPNYFLGGINRKSLLVEMELIDVFLSLGILGTTIFLIFYYRFLLKEIPVKTINIVLFGTFFLVIALSGNFLKSFSLSYLLAFLYLISIKKLPVMDKD